MKRLSLEDFLKSNSGNAWISYKSLAAYYRKSYLWIEDEKIYVLVRANTTNKKRAGNCGKNPEAKRTGLYKELCDLTEHLALQYGFEAVAVENVLNEFLPDALERYGYSQITTGIAAYPDALCKSYSKILPDKSALAA